MDLEVAVAAAWASERLRTDEDIYAQLQAAGTVDAWLAGRQQELAGGAFGEDVRAVAWHETGYPTGLRHEDLRPPPALFVRGSAGSLPPPHRCVAIVGARRCTDSARSMARSLAAVAVGEGAAVVSGLALGVDAAAHEGAIDAGGRTIAVLASPVDRPGPRANQPLADEILDDLGWLVSERPPGISPRPRDFPRRNRLVAGLASVVVVVEAGLPSGTLSTVTWALRAGRAVAAVPGDPRAPASAGTNALLRAGAHVIAEPADLAGLLPGSAVAASSPRDDDLDGDERTVWRGLAAGSATADGWVRASGLPAERALAALARLTSKGCLHRLGGGRLARSWW